MKSLRFTTSACLFALGIAGLGCGGGSSSTGTGGSGAGTAGTTGAAGTSGAAGTTGSAGTSGGAGTTGNAGTTGAAGSTATGTGGTTGAAGTTGSAGTGGATGTAGNTGTAGATGAAGATGTAGRGGTGGATGGGGRGGTTGTAGTTGSGGTGGATTPHGSAAKFICPQGATYGNPLTGMGTIQDIKAPNPDYFAFLEGPLWIGAVNTVFFSDNASSPSERIWKVVPPSTTPTIFVPASGSNGLAVDNNNRIVAADQRNLRIVTFDPMTGQTVGTPISTSGAKPNDLIVRSDNNMYFTDPAMGFYRISPAGAVSAVMKLPNNGGQPNGIELSTDENTLYVGDVAQRKIFKYALAADGTVMTSTGAEFVSQTMRDTVDGMCVDCAGNVYAGTRNAVEVYSSSGSYIGSIVTNEQTSNCTFGGADRTTLYMTTPASLKYVKLNVPGLPD